VKSAMKMIVGLGNPGREYARTRHNIGRIIVDLFARRRDTEVGRRKFKSLVGEMRTGGEKVVLLKPATFMNLSGGAVAAAFVFYKLDPERMLVICDDMDLPLGKLRLRAGGGTGGHKGLASIEASLGTQEYPRLRFGISRPESIEAADHVLAKFEDAEKDDVERALVRAVEAVEMWLGEGMEKAMNVFNPDESGRRIL